MASKRRKGIHDLKDLKAFENRTKLIMNPQTPWNTRVSLMTPRMSRGYINRLNRLQKKVKPMMRFQPGTGRRLNDLPWEGPNE